NLNKGDVTRSFSKQIHKIKENGTEERQNARRLKNPFQIDSRKMGRIYNFWLRPLPGLKSNNLGENEKINTGNTLLSCNLSFEGAQLVEW
ncbi:6653_t:CDS:2, partial [Gigaspora margarita]